MIDHDFMRLIRAEWNYVADSEVIVRFGAEATSNRPREVVFPRGDITARWNQSPGHRLLLQLEFRRSTMKPLILATAILGVVLAPAAVEAKGCIKGAIVGGIAGHVAGHGKVGAVAGCVIGHHEANKQKASRSEPAPQDKRG
jgi:hypothetical protein